MIISRYLFISEILLERSRKLASVYAIRDTRLAGIASTTWFSPKSKNETRPRVHASGKLTRCTRSTIMPRIVHTSNSKFNSASLARRKISLAHSGCACPHFPLPLSFLSRLLDQGIESRLSTRSYIPSSTRSPCRRRDSLENPISCRRIAFNSVLRPSPLALPPLRHLPVATSTIFFSENNETLTRDMLIRRAGDIRDIREADTHSHRLST